MIVKDNKFWHTGAGRISAVKIGLGRNNRVIIRIPYDQDLISRVKSISGRWNSKNQEVKQGYEKKQQSARWMYIRTVPISPQIRGM